MLNSAELRVRFFCYARVILFRVFTQPRSKAEELKVSITSPLLARKPTSQRTIDLRRFVPHRSRSPGALIDLDVEFARQPRVLVVIVVNDARKLCGGAAERFLRRLQEALAHRRIGERVVDFGVEARRYRGRRSGRNEDAEPLVQH